MSADVTNPNESGGLSRRNVLKGVGAMLGAAAFAKAIAPLTEWAPQISAEEFIQKHYKELSSIDLEIILHRLEKETKEQYGVEVTIKDYKTETGVKFGSDMYMC